MKVVIEIPPHALGNNVFIISGNKIPVLIGVIAFEDGKPVAAVKTKACSRCGTCCKMPWIQKLHIPLKENSTECEYLEYDEDGLACCAVGVNRPWVCVIGEPRGKDTPCTNEWRRVEDGAEVKLL
jgi:hypothetical protein